MSNVMTCIPNHQLRIQGAAILRVVAEVRDFVKDDPEVPGSLTKDLNDMESVGRWLINAQSINLGRTPAAGHPATGSTHE